MTYVEDIRKLCEKESCGYKNNKDFGIGKLLTRYVLCIRNQLHHSICLRENKLLICSLIGFVEEIVILPFSFDSRSHGGKGTKSTFDCH